METDGPPETFERKDDLSGPDFFATRDRRNKLQNEMRSLLDWTGLTFDHDKPFDTQNTAARPNDVAELRNYIVEIIHVCLAGGEMYTALKYLESLGETDAIRRCIAKGVRVRGQPYLDVLVATMKYGTETQKETAMKEYTKEYGDGSYDVSPRFFKYLSGAELYAGLKRYAADNQIPMPLGSLHAVNAAGELHARDYDLAIGVCKRGTATATCMKILGTPTGFVEWHKHWQRGARWRLDKPDTAQADKILICEHDIQTGKTLHALRPIVDRLNPVRVDVHLLFQDVHGKGNDRAGTPQDWNVIGHDEINRTGNAYMHSKTMVARLRELGCLPEDAPVKT